MTLRLPFPSGLAAAVLVLAASPVWAQGGPPPRTVTVVGTARSQVAPDRAVLSLTVRTEGKSAAEAAGRNAERSAKVLEAVRAKLAPGDRAETAATRLEPVQVYEQGKPPRTTGYASVHTLRVTTGKTGEVGALVDAATAAADVEVDSVRFELGDPAAARAAVLKDAVGDARARAEAIAQGLGVAVGAVRAAREVGAGGGPPPMPLARGMQMEAAATKILPQEIELTAEVEVTYELGAPRS